ncbi:hypothetical protein [Amycolatopsis speibonae]|uniref:DUF3558 domain-containing protein n=1 Tax=Amycolatopsis speibonae TaxID=1450224 RepID=A0ABV7NZ85_9PSEU
MNKFVRAVALSLSVMAVCCSCAAGEGTVVPVASPSPEAVPSATWAPAMSPEVVSAACAFLGVEELQKALRAKAAYRSAEQEVVRGQKSVNYACDFSRADDGSYIGGLMVTVAPGNTTPEALLGVAEDQCLGEGQAQPLPDAGDVAMWCRNTDLDTLVTTVKRSRGEVRIAYLTLAGAPISANIPGYGELARILGGRL